MPQISTVNMGLAVGWSAAALAYGKKGWRKSLPHSLAMLQQPRIPPTGQRQAIEVRAALPLLLSSSAAATDCCSAPSAAAPRSIQRLRHCPHASPCSTRKLASA